MLDHGMPLGELEGAIHHRIMLIGCDESLIQSILSILKGPKYEILSASTGFEAGLEEARRRSDCVVIDLSIGIGQARTIVENIRKKEIDEGPIVFAIRHDECEAEVFACGFLDCMRKPIEPKALAERLSALISTRKGDAFVDLF